MGWQRRWGEWLKTLYKMYGETLCFCVTNNYILLKNPNSYHYFAAYPRQPAAFQLYSRGQRWPGSQLTPCWFFTLDFYFPSFIFHIFFLPGKSDLLVRVLNLSRWPAQPGRLPLYQSCHPACNTSNLQALSVHTSSWFRDNFFFCSRLCRAPTRV